MERVLDLGCGTGDSWRSLHLPVEDFQIIGIDTSCERVQAANFKYFGQRLDLCVRAR